MLSVEVVQCKEGSCSHLQDVNKIDVKKVKILTPMTPIKRYWHSQLRGGRRGVEEKVCGDGPQLSAMFDDDRHLQKIIHNIRVSG